MVGGKVKEIIKSNNDVWLDVNDTTYPKDFCAIYVERNPDSDAIQVGDQVWWQGSYLMWTPQDGVREDVKIRRLSSSGVGVPDGYFDTEEQELEP